MKKLKRILKLTDPYPNLGYEISCYLKAALGLVFLILGLFFLLSTWLKKGLIIFGFVAILGQAGERIIAWEERVFKQNFASLSLVFGALLVILGLWVLWQIKLVRKFVNALFS